MPKRRLVMSVFRDVLRWHFEMHKSYAVIAEYCQLSKGGVHNIIQRFETSELSWPLSEDIDELTLKRRLYPAKERVDAELPDVDKLTSGLASAGVTRQLLWEEYRALNSEGVGRSAFYRHCKEVERCKSVLKNDFHGGEYFFVDYSGDRLSYRDRETGKLVMVEIFVGTWGASSSTYVEATASQSAQDFVASHVRAFGYFNCVPLVVMPDNLKSAVTKADRAEPTLCHLYRAFAEYYDLVILPARVARPTDKAAVESAVNVTQRRVLAPLRHQTFFSLDEINSAIVNLREDLNNRPMLAHQGQSRRERFLRDDLPLARPLPAEPFAANDAKYDIRVPKNYLVKYDNHYYSVPYTLIEHHVDLFLVGDVVEIYHHRTHIARHAKQPPNGKMSIIDAHRPESHRCIANRSKDYFLHVAEEIGPYTRVVVEGIYIRKKHDEQAHRSAQGVISLCKDYDSSRVEAAAERALHFRRAALSDLKHILKLGLDKQSLSGSGQRQLPLMEHDNLRGPDYYKGE